MSYAPALGLGYSLCLSKLSSANLLSWGIGLEDVVDHQWMQGLLLTALRR